MFLIISPLIIDHTRTETKIFEHTLTRKWLELPISGTLSNVYLTSNKFGLNIIPPSTKFIQCQTTIRTTLKSSPNESITHLWKLTKNHTNIQYDQYSATKEVIKSYRDNQENRLTSQLISQGSFFTNLDPRAFAGRR